MKFTCTQENLTKGLLLVSRIAGRNAALPILNNVLIKAETGRVRLSTTNLELGLTTTIRAKVETEGSYTVQSRLLTEFVNLIGNDNIHLESTDQGLLITSGHTKTILKGMAADEFPVLPSIQPTITMHLPGESLHRLLEGVTFAVANDESRPEISGVLLQYDGQRFIATATDSYRLAERRIPSTPDGEKKQSVIVPARTADELLRVIPDDPTSIELAMSENQFSCRTPEAEIISRTIEGHYPDYQQIIPTTAATTVRIARDEFMTAIRAASLFCKPGINDVTITADPDKKAIVLTAANTSIGEHQGQVACTMDGPSQTIVFNYRYLLEGVQSLSGDEIVLELQDAQAPGVLHPEKQRDDLYLLMPIRQ